MYHIKKVAFLFLFSYTVLYCFSTQFIFTPLLNPLWSNLTPWFAELVGETATVKNVATGSGDTLFDYYSSFLWMIISLLLAITISAINYKRQDNNFLCKWLLLIIRYFVAFQMINYGLAKIFYTQFAEPSLSALNNPLGDKSPMGLLWTFMGFSKTYCIFTGMAEFIGGFLLLSRRTTLLGALITFGVMANVMMLNYCYDVPVKLFSTHLVAFSLIIISFWSRNIIDFFFRNKGFKPVTIEDVVTEKWRDIKRFIKWGVIILFLMNQIHGAYKLSKYVEDKNAPKVAIHGIYKVERFNIYRDGELMENPPSQIVWKELKINPDGTTAINLEKSRPYIKTLKVDSLNQNVILFDNTTDSIGTTFNYKIYNENYLSLDGYLKKDSLSIMLKEREPFRLMNTPFKWVQEHPYSR